MQLAEACKHFLYVYIYTVYICQKNGTRASHLLTDMLLMSISSNTGDYSPSVFFSVMSCS